MILQTVMIIIRFADLGMRDRMLSNAKNLRNAPPLPQGVPKPSISTSLPPKIQTLRDELMLTRSQLTPEDKRQARVRTTKSWPYVHLQMPGEQANIVPSKSKSSVVESILGMDHEFAFERRPRDAPFAE